MPKRIQPSVSALTLTRVNPAAKRKPKDRASDSRLQLGEPIKEMALHPVPNRAASWWYVFGSAALVLVMLQMVTGILLALVYVPFAGQAWNSLEVLNHHLTLGWFLSKQTHIMTARKLQNLQVH